MLPTNIKAGDTFKTSFSNPLKYPASGGWTAELGLVGHSKVTVAGQANGDGFDFTLSATQTTLLKAGTYGGWLRVKKGDEVYTIASGLVTVSADLSSLATRILHCEEAIEWCKKAEQGVLSEQEAALSVSISGRSWTNLHPKDLMDVRTRYENELATLIRRANSTTRPAIKGIAVSTGRFR